MEINLRFLPRGRKNFHSPCQGTLRFIVGFTANFSSVISKIQALPTNIDDAQFIVSDAFYQILVSFTLWDFFLFESLTYCL